MNIKGKTIAVLGFGIEGQDLVEYLLSKSSRVVVYDKNPVSKFPVKDFKARGVKFLCGKDYLKDGLLKYDVIFRSPGVYRYLPEIVEAGKSGVVVSSSTKLFIEKCPARTIAVTGTKGKGTTATLIYRILKKSGMDVHLAGNIGKPPLRLLSKLNKNSWVVLELSSFQLIDLHKSPHISVVLNITSDHQDWHKNRKEYVEAKRNIVKYQNKDDFAVINSDYTDSKGFSMGLKSKVYFFSKKKKTNGCYIKDEKIVLVASGGLIEIGSVNKLQLRGEHNWENVTASVIASYLAGGDVKSIESAVFSFTGLEHRLELVGKISEVSFFNDSFSTNPQTTIAAIKSFDEPITLILGGSDKGLAYPELAKVISKKKNIDTVILTGEIGKSIGEEIEKTGYGGKLIDLKKTKMENIVQTAFKNTPEGGVVLLSPATASFGMFENYKKRGESFKAAVKKLN